MPKNRSYFDNFPKEKILEYYKNNCSLIMKNAAADATAHEYEHAIALTGSIPKAAPCFEEAQKKSLEYYLKYQAKLCATNINIAKGDIAVKDYDGALEALEEIVPQASCGADAKKLIDQIANKVTKKDNRDYTLEKMRINAIKEIGKAYFSSKAAHDSKSRH